MTEQERAAMQAAYDWMTSNGGVVFAGGGMQALDPMNAAALGLRQSLAVPDAEPAKGFQCEPQHAVTEDGFCEWVCPTPIGYLMQCCDCSLIHEVETRVAKYEPRPSEEFTVLEDPDTQAQWRMKRRDDLAKPAPAESKPVTDDEITQLWRDLQERKTKDAREAHAEQIGKVCGACNAGTFFLDSNGYNEFPRCNQCRHVPLLLNGIDMSADIASRNKKPK